MVNVDFGGQHGDSSVTARERERRSKTRAPRNKVVIHISGRRKHENTSFRLLLSLSLCRQSGGRLRNPPTTVFVPSPGFYSVAMKQTLPHIWSEQRLRNGLRLSPRLLFLLLRPASRLHPRPRPRRGSRAQLLRSQPSHPALLASQVQLFFLRYIVTDFFLPFLELKWSWVRAGSSCTRDFFPTRNVITSLSW